MCCERKLELIKRFARGHSVGDGERTPAGFSDVPYDGTIKHTVPCLMWGGVFSAPWLCCADRICQMHLTSWGAVFSFGWAAFL